MRLPTAAEIVRAICNAIQSGDCQAADEGLNRVNEQYPFARLVRGSAIRPRNGLGGEHDA